MSKINRSRLSEAEIENLRARGIEPKGSLPVQVETLDTNLVRAIDSLIAIHPPNPLIEVPYMDVIAATRINNCFDTVNSVNCVCETISAINNALSDKYERQRQERKSNKPWMQ